MDDPSLSLLIVGGSTLLGAALYATGNAALSALTEARLVAVAEGEGRTAREAVRTIERRSAIRARLLIGRVLCLASTSACAALALAPHGLWVALLGSLGAALAYGFIAQTGIAVATARGPLGQLRLLGSLRFFELLMAPVAAPLELVAVGIAALVPKAGDSPDMPARAIGHMIEKSEEEGALPEEHAAMLRSVLEFETTIAREVMVPRTQMVAFAIDTPLEEVICRIEETGHSRYPVYRDKVDQVEGVLYAKDLFRVLREGVAEPDLDKLIRAVAWVAEERKIGSVLREMQAKRFHLAIVADEFGGVAGLVTLEDILEEIVGEIEDEHDEESSRVSERAPGHYVADAGISVHDLAEILGEPLAEVDGAFDSLGGLIVSLVGRVPETGEEIAAGQFDLKILEADDRHVQQVEIVRRAS